ncbi:MAG TPA: DUF448 domain-containing protein [Candidatus Binatia bacterium]
MSKKGHRPQRTCLGCGAREEQNKLIRLVVGEGRQLKVDRLADARGGYLHPARRCWQVFLRRKSLHRAFHVEISNDAKEKLIQELTERYRE